MENVQLIENEVKLKTRKTLLWFGIISIIMLFAGLTSAYIVRQSEGKWAQFELPWTFMISTVVIILSSVPMELSLKSIKKGNSRDLVKWLVLTLLLGFGFVVAQYFAWSELFDRGIAFSSHISDIKTGYTYVPAGSETMAEAAAIGNVSASFLYAITALHILHLAGGILALIVVLSHALREKYSSVEYSGVSLCATYWHFLGILWVYLYLFLYLFR